MKKPTGKRILFATPECAPWVKTGGLGDVAAALPEALRVLGHDVRLLMPGYPWVMALAKGARRVASIPARFGLPDAVLRQSRLPNNVPVWLIDCPPLYDRKGGPYLDPHGADFADNYLRFGLLSYVAALLSCDDTPLSWKPQVLHCHDWTTGLAPAYLKLLGMPAPAATLTTIHNLAFQGLFDMSHADVLGLPPHSLQVEGVEFWGRLSFMKAGLYYSDRITTVSPTYAQEIQDEPLGFGLQGLLSTRHDQLLGILNGIDTREWNASADPALPAPYDEDNLAAKAHSRRALRAKFGLTQDDGSLLIGMVARLTGQKGIDLVLDAMDAILAQPVQLVVLGSGDRAFEDAFRTLASRYPQRVAAVIGFDEGLAHLIEAGADAFLMPSRFEPCGLNQMYSQRYGTPPIVHATGGLADSVVDERMGADATGFVFTEASAAALTDAVARAVALHGDGARWTQLQRAGMTRDFSWTASAARYAALYAHMAVQADASPAGGA
ncbi:MAG: glycogen synthase GlgA [Rhodocyclaceae bacterium]